MYNYLTILQRELENQEIIQLTFKVEVAECLNDGISNEGVYEENQETDLGNDPAEDLMCGLKCLLERYMYEGMILRNLILQLLC